MDRAEKILGQVAFEAYTKEKGGTTHDGKPIPPWEDLGDAVRGAWQAAGEAAGRADRDNWKKLLRPGQWNQVFCAALTGLAANSVIAHGLDKNGDPMGELIACAVQIADIAIGKMK